MRVDLEKRTSVLMTIEMLDPERRCYEDINVFVPIEVYENAIVQYVYKVYGITGSRTGIIALMHNFYAYDKFGYEEDFIVICKNIYMQTEYFNEDYQDYLDRYHEDYFEKIKNRIK